MDFELLRVLDLLHSFDSHKKQNIYLIDKKEWPAVFWVIFKVVKCSLDSFFQTEHTHRIKRMAYNENPYRPYIIE